MERRTPRLESFDPDIARRITQTVAGTDTDSIPKVPNAGMVEERDGQRVQVMHNGLLVEEGGYFGDWTTEIIRVLQGHHEPQEERVFHELVQRLKADADAPSMIEFGCFWSYYSLWFLQALSGSRAVGLEPDPAYLEVGRRNATLNSLNSRITFVHGGVGAPGQTFSFEAQSDGATYELPQYNLATLMHQTGLEHVDLVLADIQGAETLLLEQSARELESGRVRFLVLSTHHSVYTGDPLTHQKALALLTSLGGHVLAEHSVAESHSGDGLIAVSFDPRDKDLTIPISYARSVDSLFGEVETETAAWQARHAAANEATAQAQRHAQRLEVELVAMQAQRDAARAELDATQADRKALQTRLRVLGSLWPSRTADRAREFVQHRVLPRVRR